MVESSYCDMEWIFRKNVVIWSSNQYQRSVNSLDKENADLEKKKAQSEKDVANLQKKIADAQKASFCSDVWLQPSR